MFLLLFAVGCQAESDRLVTYRQLPPDQRARALDDHIQAATKAKQEFDAATLAKDEARIERATDSAAETMFGQVAVDPQEPGTRPQQPVQELFQGKSINDIAKDFGPVSLDTFKAAFAQEQEVAKAKAQKENSLDGFNFGTGIGLDVDVGGGRRIKSASVRNGIVRIDEEDDARLGLVLETHYFWTTTNKLVGYGPFVAVKTGDSEIIDAAGLGFMVGLRHDIEDTNSFNIGVGAMVDPNAKVLADGFHPNQPLPAGETDVATKTETRVAIAVVFSYTF